MLKRNSQKLNANSLGDVFAWSPMTPEQQRRKLNLEVSAIINALNLPESQRVDVRSAYVIAEDLALRQIEYEFELLLTRHITLEGIPFDGVAVKDNRVFCVEVLFLARPELPQIRLETIFDKVEHSAKHLQKALAGAKVRLLLALVTQLTAEGDKTLRHKLAEKFSLTPVDVDVRLLDFEELQHTFLNE